MVHAANDREVYEVLEERGCGNMLIFFLRLKLGVSNIQPAAQILPAGVFNPAHMNSESVKLYFIKY